MKKFIGAVVFVTVGCLAYVFAEVETFKVGYTIRKQEDMKTQLLDRARALKYNIARLKSPANLERKLIAQKILLESPKSWQTLVLNRRAPERQRADWVRTVWNNPAFLGKLFIGTAEAQAKESSN